MGDDLQLHLINAGVFCISPIFNLPTSINEHSHSLNVDGGAAKSDEAILQAIISGTIWIEHLLRTYGGVIGAADLLGRAVI
jgi:hypothetical protein